MAVCVTVAVLGIAYGVGKFLGDLGHALTDDPSAESERDSKEE